MWLIVEDLQCFNFILVLFDVVSKLFYQFISIFFGIFTPSDIDGFIKIVEVNLLFLISSD